MRSKIALLVLYLNMAVSIVSILDEGFRLNEKQDRWGYISLWGMELSCLYFAIIGGIMCFMTLLILFLRRKYHKYVSFFYLMEQMVNASNVQTMREMAFVAYHNILNHANRLKIRRVDFNYTIEKSNDQTNYLDVKYGIRMKIEKLFWWHLREKSMIPFGFFTIKEKEVRPDQHNINILMEKGGEEIKFVIRELSAATSVYDANDLFQGIYKIETAIPKEYLKKDDISFSCEYEMKSNISLNDEEKGEYAFTVIPRNYGTKIKDLKICINVEKEYELAAKLLVVRKIGKEIERHLVSCLLLREESEKDRIYQIEIVGKQIDMDAVYFVILTLWKSQGDQSGRSN